MDDPIKRLIITDGTVSNPRTGQSMQVKIMWDTGASSTCIAHSVVNQLGLKPFSAVLAQSANSSDRLGMFFVNMDLGPSAFNDLPVAGLANSQRNVADVLLGMDIIGRGDMHLTHRDGKLVFRWE